MATIIQGEKRVAFGHYGFYQTHAGGDLPVIVRRTIGDPTCWMHSNSRPVLLQRERFKRAVQHYASLTPPQKWLSKRRLGDVEYIDNHGKTQVKMLSGRQLVISEDIHELTTTGHFTEQPFQVCIILCDPDYEPLKGTLHLEYRDAGGWHEVEGRELVLGNWLFVEVPGKMESYWVWGETEGWIDPDKPEDRNLSEAQLKAKHWYRMEAYVGEKLTSFSDPSHEITSVDGYVLKRGRYRWEDIRHGDATEYSDTLAWERVGWAYHSWVDWYSMMSRSIHLFDTKLLPNGCEIVSAALSIFVTHKIYAGLEDGAFNIYGCNPVTEDNICMYDYDNISTAPLSTSIPMRDIEEGKYSVWYLNAAGRAAIEREGITKLALRESHYDAPNREPEWEPRPQCYIHIYFAECDSIHQRPRLDIIYRG